MISLKKYLDGVPQGTCERGEETSTGVLSAAIEGYSSALIEMGQCSLEACPAIGGELNLALKSLERRLHAEVTVEVLRGTKTGAEEHLRSWGRQTADHYRKKADEVKEILLAMARTAESVGGRDQRCAQQLNAVTSRLKTIANLDDLTEIRAAVESSAAELRTSVERMVTEGKTAVDSLRSEVTRFQAKLEEAEKAASTDSLTGLRNRPSVEGHIERRIAAETPFCAMIVDIDHFKQVNDEHGHWAGDELLRQFAAELKSRCRSKDIVGRWGGDEFIVLLDCGLAEAEAQSGRLAEWIRGNYSIQGPSGAVSIRVDASIGLAEHGKDESKSLLLDRADAAMYRNKRAAHASG